MAAGLILTISIILLAACGSEEPRKVEETATETVKQPRSAKMKEFNQTAQEEQEKEDSGTLLTVNADLDFNFVEIRSTKSRIRR